MPILTNEIKFYLSGGVSNADISASLGGVISSVEVDSASLNNLFNVITPGEALTGDTEYKCIYAKNTNATLTLFDAVAWIVSNTPNLESTINIGLGSSSISAVEQTVGTDATPPSAVAFSTPASQGGGLAIGDLAPGATMAVWVRRTIDIAADAYSTDTATISVGGGTPA